jgi:O-methyltransferase
MNSEIERLNFIPNYLNENDFELYLDSKKYDILLHKSELEFLVKICDYVNNKKLHGDVVECGVWKGGSAVLLSILLNRNEFCSIRNFWLADYFGSFYNFNSEIMMPKEYDTFTKVSKLKISPPTLDEVKLFIGSFNLSIRNFKFLIGDVRNTLEHSEIQDIFLLHLDLDFYDSTIHALEVLYPKVLEGGIILINDYNVNNLNCKEAILKFKKDNNISNPIIEIGRYMAYWIK